MSEPVLDKERLKQVIARDVLNLYVKCHEYVQLVGTDSKRIVILNRAASKFFQIFQEAAWSDLVIDLARITGPMTTGREPRIKHNLTIGRLPDLVGQKFQHEVKEKVKLAIKKSDFVIEARNQILAHRDLGVALSSNAGGIRRGNSHEMADAVYAVKEAVETAFPGYIAWQHATSLPGGSDDLVASLDFALKQKAL
jgi:hypothetical protein